MSCLASATPCHTPVTRQLREGLYRPGMTISCRAGHTPKHQKAAATSGRETRILRLTAISCAVPRGDLGRQIPSVDNLRPLCRSLPCVISCMHNMGRTFCQVRAPYQANLCCFHIRIPSLRTGQAACLHSLSTGLCTPRLDEYGESLKTVRGVGKNHRHVVLLQAPGAFR